MGSEAALDKSVLNFPDFVVFDLDPYEYSGREGKGEEPELHRRAFTRTRELALRLRDLLAALGLEIFVKTSGRTGLHLYLPILRKFDYDAARSIAETIGRYALQLWPQDVTLEWAVERRTGKIFFDYNQNSRGKSLAAIFSPRRHPLGTVSMPVAWEQLERIYPTDFTLRTVPDLLEEQGDPWSGILTSKQDLGELLEASNSMTRTWRHSRVPGGLRRRPMPTWLPPMLATLTEELPREGKWVYEPKLDGVRALIYVSRGSVRMYSRNRKPLNDAYPELVEALRNGCGAMRSSMGRSWLSIRSGASPALRGCSSVCSYGIRCEPGGARLPCTCTCSTACTTRGST